MKRIIFPAILALLASRLASAQGASALLPSTLPSCAGQCTVLQQAATGCTPAGGAPVANQATYQSCFCQSALLPSLFSTTAVQLCSTCSASDMASIQSWYKNLCGKGAGVANSPDSPSSTSAAPSASKATGKSSTTPTSGASVSNSQGNTSSTDQTSNGPWLQTHYKWIIMLIVVFIGLSLLAVGGWFLHRRYHRKREAKWSSASGSQPNINTWGPGQSVHDLGYTPGTTPGGGSSISYGWSEKGKSRQPMSTYGGPTEPQQSYGGGRNKSGLRNEVFDDDNKF